SELALPAGPAGCAWLGGDDQLHPPPEIEGPRLEEPPLLPISVVIFFFPCAALRLAVTLETLICCDTQIKCVVGNATVRVFFVRHPHLRLTGSHTAAHLLPLRAPLLRAHRQTVRGNMQ